MWLKGTSMQELENINKKIIAVLNYIEKKVEKLY